jgi:hypothetical protein
VRYGEPCHCRYCEEKFISKYIPTIGVDYGVKAVKIADYEVGKWLSNAHVRTLVTSMVALNRFE